MRDKDLGMPTDAGADHDEIALLIFRQSRKFRTFERIEPVGERASRRVRAVFVIDARYRIVGASLMKSSSE